MFLFLPWQQYTPVIYNMSVFLKGAFSELVYAHVLGN